MTDTHPRFIDVVEVADLVRKKLKKVFPNVRFSVTSDRYPGGTSVHVKWNQGPQETEVRATVKQFAGARSDGDYSPRPVYHYLRPDGEVMLAYNPPSSAIGASDPEGEDNRAMARLMPSDYELVQFGADYVFCHREPSDEEAAEIQKKFDEARSKRNPEDLPF